MTESNRKTEFGRTGDSKILLERSVIVVIFSVIKVLLV